LFKTNIVAVSMLALGLAGSAHAAIIGNGPPNQTGGSDLNAFLEADNFTLGGSFTITQIKYWSLQNTLADYAGTTDWASTRMPRRSGNRAFLRQHGSHRRSDNANHPGPE